MNSIREDTRERDVEPGPERCAQHVAGLARQLLRAREDVPGSPVADDKIRSAGHVRAGEEFCGAFGRHVQEIRFDDVEAGEDDGERTPKALVL